MRKATVGLLLTAGLVLCTTARTQPIEAPQEIRGSVERWAPSERVIKVGGETYALSMEVQVIDGRTALLNSRAVRPGGKVMLFISHGEVSHVVVNPGVGPVMDQPQR